MKYKQIYNRREEFPPAEQSTNERYTVGFHRYNNNKEKHMVGIHRCKVNGSHGGVSGDYNIEHWPEQSLVVVQTTNHTDHGGVS
jgi:hypothetical protein